MAGAVRNPAVFSKDGIAALAWIAFGGFLFWQSFLLLGIEEDSARGAFGPAFYPRLLAVLLMALGIALLIKDIRNRRSVAVNNTNETYARTPLGLSGLGLSITAFIGLLLYTYLLDKIGYLLVTPLMLLGLMVLMGERRWLMIILWAIGFSTGLYLLFRYGLRVILPEGLLY